MSIIIGSNSGKSITYHDGSLAYSPFEYSTTPLSATGTSTYRYRWFPPDKNLKYLLFFSAVFSIPAGQPNGTTLAQISMTCEYPGSINIDHAVYLSNVIYAHGNWSTTISFQMNLDTKIMTNNNTTTLDSILFTMIDYGTTGSFNITDSSFTMINMDYITPP